jgi:hypothetical protein
MSSHRPPIEPRYFDLKGAFEYLGGAISVRRLRQAIKEPGGLRCFRVGGPTGKILFAREDLDSYARRCPNEPVNLDALVDEVLEGLNEKTNRAKVGKQSRRLG